MQALSSASADSAVALPASPAAAVAVGGLSAREHPAPAARRLFAPEPSECLQEACGVHLEPAGSSNIEHMLLGHWQPAHETPMHCTPPASTPPACSLLRRVPMQRPQHNLNGARACRMLPGLAPGDAAARQQLQRWLCRQEAELDAAAQRAARLEQMV